MLGVQRTSVTMVARQLQTDGLINYRRGRVEIIDRYGLEKRVFRESSGWFWGVIAAAACR
jgi:Mn-dependent DtxR family transcriptional regulator